jgi:hypothetical protein
MVVMMIIVKYVWPVVCVWIETTAKEPDQVGKRQDKRTEQNIPIHEASQLGTKVIRYK